MEKIEKFNSNNIEPSRSHPVNLEDMCHKMISDKIDELTDTINDCHNRITKQEEYFKKIFETLLKIS